MATVGTFSIGGRTSTLGVGVYNIAAARWRPLRVIAWAARHRTLTKSGGQIFLRARRQITSRASRFFSGTNSLNGGTAHHFKRGHSTGTNAVFNFNGGTLQAGFNPHDTRFSGGILAYVQSGGAFVDSSNFNVTISTPLLRAARTAV